jgi:hypothetical protein
MDMGLQVDPVASATSASIMIGCVWGYMNMVNFHANRPMRQRRDGEAQLLRNAKALVLAGKLDRDTYGRAAVDAGRAAQEYDAAKTAVGRRPARMGVPTATPRLSRILASLSSPLAQPDKQDDQEDLLQDFKDHLIKIQENGPQPRVHAGLSGRCSHPGEQDDQENVLQDFKDRLSNM